MIIIGSKRVIQLSSYLEVNQLFGSVVTFLYLSVPKTSCITRNMLFIFFVFDHVFDRQFKWAKILSREVLQLPKPFSQNLI